MESIALLPLLPGTISVFLAIVGFYRTHIRHIGTFEVLKSGWKESITSLREISPKSKNTKNEIKEQELIRLLAQGDLIVEPVKRKLQARLTFALTAILLTTVAALVDTTGQIDPSVQNIEYIDIFLFIVQIAVVIMANWTDVFISKTEQEFLGNISTLHAIYYDKHIMPALREFNRQFSSSILADEIKLQNSETEHIRKIVREEVKKVKRNKWDLDDSVDV